MNLELNGKTALVTGGSSGLGAAICRALLVEGARVWSISRSEPTGAGVGFIPADLAVPGEVETVMRRAREAAGAGPDILVNCAGSWPTHFVRETTLADWQRTLDVNLTSLFVLSRDFVNDCLPTQRRGVILNITSQAAFGGATSGHADYAAAKAGVVNFTKSLAREVAGAGIRVNALAPGMMETPMSAEALADRREKYLERIPLGRIADPAEVADVAVFLCSDRAGYMTGTTVDVSGGMIMR
jgi:3-oxoacyl-[acyl-carrier protein] reductase